MARSGGPQPGRRSWIVASAPEELYLRAAACEVGAFPPGVRVSDAASTVSPGLSASTNVRSMFTLPTTHTQGAMGPTLVSLAFAMLAVG